MLAEIQVFVLIADNHDYETGSQWVAGIFLTEQEAEDARLIEEAKPGTNACNVFPWTMIVDRARIFTALDQTVTRTIVEGL